MKKLIVPLILLIVANETSPVKWSWSSEKSDNTGAISVIGVALVGLGFILFPKIPKIFQSSSKKAPIGNPTARFLSNKKDGSSRRFDLTYSLKRKERLPEIRNAPDSLPLDKNNSNVLELVEKRSVLADSFTHSPSESVEKTPMPISSSKHSSSEESIDPETGVPPWSRPMTPELKIWRRFLLGGNSEWEQEFWSGFLPTLIEMGKKLEALKAAVELKEEEAAAKA